MGHSTRKLQAVVNKKDHNTCCGHDHNGKCQHHHQHDTHELGLCEHCDNHEHDHDHHHAGHQHHSEHSPLDHHHASHHHATHEHHSGCCGCGHSHGHSHNHSHAHEHAHAHNHGDAEQYVEYAFDNAEAEEFVRGITALQDKLKALTQLNNEIAQHGDAIYDKVRNKVNMLSNLLVEVEKTDAEDRADNPDAINVSHAISSEIRDVLRNNLQFLTNLVNHGDNLSDADLREILNESYHSINASDFLDEDDLSDDDEDWDDWDEDDDFDFDFDFYDEDDDSEEDDLELDSDEDDEDDEDFDDADDDDFDDDFDEDDDDDDYDFSFYTLDKSGSISFVSSGGDRVVILGDDVTADSSAQSAEHQAKHDHEHGADCSCGKHHTSTDQATAASAASESYDLDELRQRIKNQKQQLLEEKDRIKAIIKSKIKKN